MVAPKRIAAIDGNSLLHRAYHAIAPTMNAPDGTPTNAVFGFLSMFLKFNELYKPDAIICAFDAGKPIHRIKALEQYKAQRPHMDEELRVQFPLIQELLTAMNVPVVTVPGWEGDDILGTIAARNESLGYRTLLVTGDKDANQLASDLTCIVTTKRGITDVVEYDPAAVYEKYGVTVQQFPDFLGLMGDSSDNIPGVPGIGAKTAAKLLQQYGSLDSLYEHVNELRGKQKENIQNNKDAAYLSREIATIVCDLDFEYDPDTVHFPNFDSDVVIKAFKKLQLNMHLGKVLALLETQESDVGSHTLVVPSLLEVSDNDSATLNKAKELIQAALDKRSVIGVAAIEPEKETLFDNPQEIVAFSTDENVVCMQGLPALQQLAQIVRSGKFVTFGLHEILHLVYPPDTSQVALVTQDEIATMQAFSVSLAAYDLNSSQSPYTVQNVFEKYTDLLMPQDLEDNASAQCAAQATAVRLLEPLLRSQLSDEGLSAVYENIDAPLVSVLLDMERIGAALDVDTLEQLGSSTEVQLDELRSKIIGIAGEDFNIDSPQQLAHILFEVLGLPPKKKTTRGYSTNAAVLTELAAEGSEIAALVIKYRELFKIKSTYIDALPRMLSGDGRVHTSFNETVTATGRLSSSNPNLQNIPVRTDFGRSIRACFVPLEAGDVFLSADYSQIELRLLAHLSADSGLISAFNSGEDFHSATAAELFGVKDKQVSSDLRRRAKAVNFGIVYGQQAFGLAQSLDISVSEANEIIQRYFESYPGVRKYLDDVISSSREKGYAETMFGRRRYIPELHANNKIQRAFGERTAMNHPIQGSAADIIKLAMIQVQHKIKQRGFKAQLLLQVHDELDFSVPKEEVSELKNMVIDVMQNVVELRVPLLVDVNEGSTWADAH